MALKDNLLVPIPFRDRTSSQASWRALAPFVLALVFLGSVRAGSFDDNTDLIRRLHAAEEAGRIEEARHWASRLMEQERAVHSEGPLLPAALEHLASLDQDQAKFDEAERFYQESISLWEKHVEAFPLELANSLNGLGSLYNAMGKLTRAEALCRRALALRLAHLGPSHADVAISYSNLAVTLLREKNFREAETVAQHALALWNQLHSEQDRSAVDLNTLALVRRQQRDFPAAIALDQAAIRKCRQSPPADRWSLLSYIHTLAVIQWDAGQLSESVVTFQEGWNLIEAGPFPNGLEKCHLLTDYAVVLRKVGQKKRAKVVDRQAKTTCSAVLKRNPAQRYVVDVKSLVPKF